MSYDCLYRQVQQEKVKQFFSKFKISIIQLKKNKYTRYSQDYANYEVYNWKFSYKSKSILRNDTDQDADTVHVIHMLP